MLKVLDLFSGIGGFSLGLERTGGFQTVAFCEIEPYARRVLAKHWPDIFIHDDVRTLNKDTLCRGYAENALLNQLCKETGGSSASVRDVITNIRKHAERRTHLATMNEPLSVEEALSTIMAGNAPAAGSVNTHFWQSIINLITGEPNAPSTRGLYGSSLSGADFLATIRFCVITATWRSPSTVPALIKEAMKVDRYDRIAADGISVDVICGGFPCQDISFAGKGAGLEGERSGLWSEIARLAGELRPRFLIVENVSALLGRGLDRVLGDLASLGFDAEWHCIPASALGAPHRRDRFWLVAYPDAAERREVGSPCGRVAWAECLSQWQKGSGGFEPSREALADAPCERPREAGQLRRDEPTQRASGHGEALPHSGCEDVERQWAEPIRISPQLGNPSNGGWWLSEPNVGRVAHGVPARVDRLRCLGNSVVPQVVTLIGHAILEAERAA